MTSSTVTAIRLPKAAELVANRLRHQVITGAVREGETFPNEAQLASELEVSRPTVREAMRILEAEGLVNVRRGVGGGARALRPSVATAARYAGTVLQYEEVKLSDIFECRAILETPAVSLLAARNDDEDMLGRLQNALDDEAAAINDHAGLTRSEGAFHRVVVELAGNKSLALFCSIVNHVVAMQTRQVMSETQAGARERALAGHKAHVKLIEHIRAGEVRKAENLWARHLASGRDYLLSSPTATTALDLLP